MTDPLNNILWTALITPFDHHGEIDYTSLMNLIQLQEEAGNGILLLGSTGEGLAINFDEKQRLIEYVAAKSINVPLMVGVGGHQFEEQVRWVQFCQKFPIDAFLLVTPYYARPGYCGQMKWFSGLMDTATKPCMLYNIPKRAGCSLDLKAVQDLNSHPNFWAIKEASGSVEEFAKYQAATKEKRIYCGNDNMMAKLSASAGLVGVMSNIWPKATRYFVAECLKQIHSEVILEATAASEAANTMNPLAAKFALFKKGLINCPNTKLPLCIQDFQDSARLDDADQKMSRFEAPVSVS